MENAYRMVLFLKNVLPPCLWGFFWLRTWKFLKLEKSEIMRKKQRYHLRRHLHQNGKVRKMPVVYRSTTNCELCRSNSVALLFEVLIMTSVPISLRLRIAFPFYTEYHYQLGWLAVLYLPPMPQMMPGSNFLRGYSSSLRPNLSTPGSYQYY